MTSTWRKDQCNAPLSDTNLAIGLRGSWIIHETIRKASKAAAKIERLALKRRNVRSSFALQLNSGMRTDITSLVNEEDVDY